MNKYLEAYLPLVEFLADCMGNNTEVVLHDLTDWSCSIVAIRNGHISGREVGSPITDLTLQVLNAAKFEKTPYMVNYHGRGQNGNILKSSTYFIKDRGDNIVGMLCMNTDFQNVILARDLMNQLIGEMGIPSDIMNVTENFNMSVNELIENNIRKVCPDIHKVAKDMSQKEKIELVDKLNEMGTFLMKGAVGFVADCLEVSIPTIYRYINIIKKE